MNMSISEQLINIEKNNEKNIEGWDGWQCTPIIQPNIILLLYTRLPNLSLLILPYAILHAE